MDTDISEEHVASIFRVIHVTKAIVKSRNVLFSIPSFPLAQNGLIFLSLYPGSEHAFISVRDLQLAYFRHEGGGIFLENFSIHLQEYLWSRPTQPPIKWVLEPPPHQE
jgi:hypothetical protein